MKLSIFSYFIISFFLLIGCQSNRRQSLDIGRYLSSKPIDLVFDLDWTLVSELLEGGQEISESNKVIVHGVEYRINDWALEMVTELSQRENVRISFFSGGNRSRNTELLSKLKLLDGSGKSFLDIAHKVKSYEDLYEIPSEMVSGEKFTDRFRKDLRKINADLSDVLLIDDNYRFAINDSQRKNILWLGPTYIHYEKLSNFPSLPIDPDIEEFVPKTKNQWFLARNKLLLIWGVLDQTLEQENGEFLAKVERLTSELEFESGELNQNIEELYKKNYWKLKRQGFRLGRITPSNQCHDLIKTFF